MITVKQARRLLGTPNSKISDQDVQSLLNQFYELAEVVAETVITRGSKNKSKGIEMTSREAHNGV